MQPEQLSRGVSVVIENVSKTYETRDGDEVLALCNTNLRVAAGEFVVIVGPSGCGKSTLLSLVAGLMPASSGRITIDDETIVRPHSKIGMVFQTDLLLYWRTIMDNVLLPIEIRGWDRQKYRRQADALLKQVGLEGFATRYPTELSGGMRQRVSICRALVQEPGLLLMDEPFGALDALTREQMITDLQATWKDAGNTIIFITHSIEEAVFLGDRVIVLSPRPGRIEMDLAIEIERPRAWKDRADSKFVEYTTRIHDLFVSCGVLSKQ
jgi:NitT/TauT family transport system ATP-binding protein